MPFMGHFQGFFFGILVYNGISQRPIEALGEIFTPSAVNGGKDHGKSTMVSTEAKHIETTMLTMIVMSTIEVIWSNNRNNKSQEC